jgi:hypothetical protein
MVSMQKPNAQLRSATNGWSCSIALSANLNFVLSSFSAHTMDTGNPRFV